MCIFEATNASWISKLISRLAKTLVASDRTEFIFVFGPRPRKIILAHFRDARFTTTRSRGTYKKLPPESDAHVHRTRVRVRNRFYQPFRSSGARGQWTTFGYSRIRLPKRDRFRSLCTRAALPPVSGYASRRRVSIIGELYCPFAGSFFPRERRYACIYYNISVRAGRGRARSRWRRNNNNATGTGQIEWTCKRLCAHVEFLRSIIV